MIEKIKKKRGFTLIELVLVIVIISVLAAVAVNMMNQPVDEERFNATTAEINNIKTAIIGNPSLISNQTRTSFGYVGDMGNLPQNLDDLVNKGSQPDFTINAATGIGMGWNGPYLSQEFSEETDGYKRDAWGTEYKYDQSSGTIISAGSDRSFGSGSGYAQDITKTITQSEYLADISGAIKGSSGSPIIDPSWVSITLYYPDKGKQTSFAATVATDGTYVFNNIPIGIRRIVISPLVGNLGDETTQLTLTQPSVNNIDIALHGNEKGSLYYVQGSSEIIGPGRNIAQIDTGNSDKTNTIIITGMQISWKGGPNWGNNKPQLRRIYRRRRNFWRAKTTGDGKSGEFIDLDRNIEIKNKSVLNDLSFEFGVPTEIGGGRRRRIVWIPINMERTSFNIEDYFSAGRSRTVSFATP